MKFSNQKKWDFFEFEIKKIYFKIEENSNYKLICDGFDFLEILKNEKIRKMRIKFLEKKKKNLKFDPKFLSLLVSQHSSHKSEDCNNDFFCVQDIRTPFD